MSAMCGSAMNVSVCVCFLDEDWIIITTLNLLATAHTDHCTVRTDSTHRREESNTKTTLDEPSHRRVMREITATLLSSYTSQHIVARERTTGRPIELDRVPSKLRLNFRVLYLTLWSAPRDKLLAAPWS